MLTMQRKQIRVRGMRSSVAAAARRAWRAAAALAPRYVPRASAGHTPDPLAALLPAGVPRYLRVWSPADLERIAANDRVLVLGAEAVALDFVKTLAQRGHLALIRLVTDREALPLACCGPS